MASKGKQNIFLYSGYTPRSSALMDRVKKASGEFAKVLLIEDPTHILLKRVQDVESIAILDLPNIKQSAVEIIREVAEKSSDIKILAIHIYTTKLLVEPLIKAGISGYLMYEPSIAELREAIASVSRNELYLPPQIYR